MRTDEVFDTKSKGLGAKDLQGKRVTVQIAGYEVKKFDDGSKPILNFVGKEKSLVLNKTNAFSIQMLLGTNEMDEWIGARITLKPDKTLYEGKMVDCIRISDTLPAPLNPQAPVRKPAPPPEPEDFQATDDDVPF